LGLFMLGRLVAVQENEEEIKTTSDNLCLFILPAVGGK